MGQAIPNQDQIAQQADKFAKVATDAYHQATDKMTDTVDHLRKQGRHVLKATESTVSDKPFLAIGMAIGVGVLFGLSLTSFFRRS